MFNLKLWKLWIVLLGMVSITGFSMTKTVYQGHQFPAIQNFMAGYIVYTPDNMQPGVSYPILLAFHGLGQNHNATTIDVNKMEGEGIPNLVAQNQFTERDFIIVTPQTRYSWYSAAFYTYIDELIDIVKTQYPVDMNRIYMTGWSAGGDAIERYMPQGNYNIAAIAPMATWPEQNTTVIQQHYVGTPAWGFMGQSDGYGSMNNFINRLNNNGGTGHLTLFPGLGHVSGTWQPALRGDAFTFQGQSFSLYDWFLQYQNSNTTGNTGTAPVLTLPENEELLSGQTFVLNYSVSDAEGDAVTVSVQSAPPFVTLDEVAKTITIAADANVSGTFSVLVDASDGQNSTTEAFSIQMFQRPSLPTTNGLAFATYLGSWTVLPDFQNISIEKNGTIQSIGLNSDVLAQNSQSNPVTQNFGLVYETQLLIERGESITFYLNSDDGSRLLVNENVVVNNDGLHSAQEVTGQLALTPGLHDLRIEYFEGSGNGGEILTVKISSDSITKTALPLSSIFPGTIEAPANRAPELNVIANISVQEGQQSNSQISAHDADGDTLIFSLQNAPNFVTLSETSPSPVMLQIDAATASAGDYTFDVTVSDGELSDSQQLTVSVTPVPSSVVAYRVNIFSCCNYPTPTPGWNEFNPAFGNIDNLVDENGANSNIDIVKVSHSGSFGTNKSGMSNNGQGPFPTNAMKTFLYTTAQVNLKVKDLSVGAIVNLEFFGSRSIVGSDRKAIYTSQGQSVELDAASNIANTARIDGLVADSNGEISFTVSPKAGSVYAYLNILIVEVVQ